MPQAPHTTLEVQDGVAVLTLVNPPVNALHPAGESLSACMWQRRHDLPTPLGANPQPAAAPTPAVLSSLFDNLRQAQARPDVKAIVIQGAGGEYRRRRRLRRRLPPAHAAPHPPAFRAPRRSLLRRL